MKTVLWGPTHTLSKSGVVTVCKKGESGRVAGESSA